MDKDEPATPEALQQRIEAMRESQDPKFDDQGTSLGHAIALFLSMGFSFAGTLVFSLMLGDYLVKRTGQQYWYLVMLAVGLFSGLSVVWRLLQPLMNKSR